MRNRVFQMLGIAAKSGNVVSGEFSTEKAIKPKQPETAEEAVQEAETAPCEEIVIDEAELEK